MYQPNGSREVAYDYLKFDGAAAQERYRQNEAELQQRIREQNHWQFPSSSPSAADARRQSNHNLRQEVSQRPPFDWNRKILHTGIGTVVATAYAFGNEHKVMIGLWSTLGTLLVLEELRFNFPKFNELFVRRFELLRKHEVKKLHSGIYFFAGIAASLNFFHKLAAIPAVLLLSFCDSATSIVGYHFGTKRISWLNNKKRSAVLFSAGLGAVITFIFLRSEKLPINLGTEVLLSVFAGGLTSITEALSFRLPIIGVHIDDDLTIPIFTSAFLQASLRALKIIEK